MSRQRYLNDCGGGGVACGGKFVDSVSALCSYVFFVFVLRGSSYESISPSWIEEEGLTATDDNKSLTSMGLALTTDG